MTDKEQIIIDGKGCRYKTWDVECSLTGDHYGDNLSPCKFIDEKSCYFKQLQKEKFENLNNRQMVESAENLIYENSELYKSLKEKEQECEELEEKNKVLQKLVSELEYSVQVGIELDDRYFKALEEIDKVINNIFDKCLGHKTDSCTPVHNVCEKLINILDIINEAKGK